MNQLARRRIQVLPETDPVNEQLRQGLAEQSDALIIELAKRFTLERLDILDQRPDDTVSLEMLAHLSSPATLKQTFQALALYWTRAMQPATDPKQATEKDQAMTIPSVDALSVEVSQYLLIQTVLKTAIPIHQLNREIQVPVTAAMIQAQNELFDQLEAIRPLIQQERGLSDQLTQARLAAQTSSMGEINPDQEPQAGQSLETLPLEPLAAELEKQRSAVQQALSGLKDSTRASLSPLDSLYLQSQTRQELGQPQTDPSLPPLEQLAQEALQRLKSIATNGDKA
jgi:hypothetical protein